jgi:hypothetical protein
LLKVSLVTFFVISILWLLLIMTFDSWSCDNRQTLGESASLPQYLGCNTVFDMRLRVTFLRRMTVSHHSNIAHREYVLKWRQ